MTENKTGLFEGVLLLSDIDGTLTDDRGQISDENAAAIRYFQREGGRFTVASGRYPTYIERYADRFVPNTYIVGINGTELYDPETQKTVLTRRFDDREAVRNILFTMQRECPLTMFALCTYREERWVSKEDFDKTEQILDSMPPLWHKMIFVQKLCDTAADQRYLAALAGDAYEIDRSWAEGIELHPKNSGKGALVPEMKRLLAAHGHPIHTVVCVGDFENDLSMCRTADIAYAVENAIPELKAAAHRVTVHHNDSAIAHIIADLERDMRARS
ncbi:MAG: HAD family phosphatase [Clostridia bacterium]|nr:HAD family phosphatase [Clostridia bacterium]